MVRTLSPMPNTSSIITITWLVPYYIHTHQHEDSAAAPHHRTNLVHNGHLICNRVRHYFFFALSASFPATPALFRCGWTCQTKCADEDEDQDVVFVGE